MKWLIPLLCLLTGGYIASAQNIDNVGIGTTTPDTASILDLNSTTKALLLPRIGNARLNSMHAREGMLAYGSDTAALMTYSGAKPETIASLDGPGPGLLVTPAVNTYYGQSFTPTAPFALQSIAFYGQYSSANAFNTTVSITLFAGAAPGGTPLATISAPVFQSTSSSTFVLRGDFSGTGIQLQAGQTYFYAVRFFSVGAGFQGLRYSNTTIPGSGTFSPGNTLWFDIKGRKLSWKPVYTTYNLPAALEHYVDTGSTQTITGLKTFTGDIAVGGAVKTAAVQAPANGTGSSNMLAVAYGKITADANGSISGSSGNYSVIHPSVGVYTIVFNFGTALVNEPIYALPVIVSLFDSPPGFISYNAGGPWNYSPTPGQSVIIVYTYNTSGIAVDRSFSFAVFKP